MSFKSGFVSIVGRPNVGKSTILNQLVGQKIAITSDKAQTTRNQIQGVLTNDEAQVIFIDTPGIHKPQNSLGDYMVKSAISSLSMTDVIWFVVDASQKRGPGDDFIIEQLKQIKNKPIYLIVNKIDLISKNDLLMKIDEYQVNDFEWSEVFSISALNGSEVQDLVNDLIEKLPVGPRYFDEDFVTDQPERVIAAEIIREKILQLTHQEIPHSVAVVIDTFKREPNQKLLIEATIMVERATQKNILIGKQGSMIKQIGQLARRDIEILFDEKVNLQTWVKVKENWRDKQSSLHEFGYDLRN